MCSFFCVVLLTIVFVVHVFAHFIRVRMHNAFDEFHLEFHFFLLRFDGENEVHSMTNFITAEKQKSEIRTRVHQFRPISQITFTNLLNNESYLR